MKTPQDRQAMVGAMPPIDPQIQEQQIEQKPAGAAEPLRPPLKSEPGGRRRDRYDHQGRDRRVDACKAEVLSEPPERPGGPLEKPGKWRPRRRTKPLQHEQCREEHENDAGLAVQALRNLFHGGYLPHARSSHLAAIGNSTEIPA